MAKPILLQKVGSKWTVYVDVDAARRYAPIRVRSKVDAQWPQGGLVAVSRSPRGGLSFGDAPAKFSKGDAEHVAHQIGRYMLDLGDFVESYTDVRR